MQQYWGIWSDVALVLCGLSVLVLAVGSVWLRAKQIARDDRNGSDRALLHRLERIEQIVETSAVELERVAEAQRFAAKLMAARGAGPVERTPERVITPH